jgi:hypothetical protein
VWGQDGVPTSFTRYSYNKPDRGRSTATLCENRRTRQHHWGLMPEIYPATFVGDFHGWCTWRHCWGLCRGQNFGDIVGDSVGDMRTQLPMVVRPRRLSPVCPAGRVAVHGVHQRTRGSVVSGQNAVDIRGHIREGARTLRVGPPVRTSRCTLSVGSAAGRRDSRKDFSRSNQDSSLHKTNAHFETYRGVRCPFVGERRGN